VRAGHHRPHTQLKGHLPFDMRCLVSCVMMIIVVSTCNLSRLSLAGCLAGCRGAASDLLGGIRIDNPRSQVRNDRRRRALVELCPAQPSIYTLYDSICAIAIDIWPLHDIAITNIVWCIA